MPRLVVAETVPVLVPPDRVNTTVESPVVFRFPFASLAVRVRVTVDPAATVPEETEITD